VTQHDTDPALKRPNASTAGGGHDHDQDAPTSPAGGRFDGERGRTTIAERAVERIATRLIAEAEHVGGTARRMLGVTVGAEDPGREAKVHAYLQGDTAVSLVVRCSVPYPTPVAQVTHALRARLIERVGALTGLVVQRVDITITALTTSAGVRVQ